MPLPIVGNLRRAARDRETASIGGGDFGPEELKQAARMIENHDELLTALQEIKPTLAQALEALDCISSPLHVREINKIGAATQSLRASLQAIARATSKD